MKKLILTIIISFSYLIGFSQTWTVFHYPKSFYDIAIDTNNNLWSAGEDGLYKYNGSIWSIFDLSNSPLNPLSYSRATSVFIDNKSNIWVGFVDGYVIKFDGDTTWSNEVNLGGGDIKAINQDKYGNIWVGGPSTQLSKFDGINWTHPFNLFGVFAIDVDAENNVWIGTSSSGLIKYGNDSTLTTYNTSNSGISDNWVESICQGTNNDLWVGTRFGINIFDKNTSWQSYNTSNSGLNNNTINSIAIDTDSLVWVANNPSAIGKFENGIWSSINFSNIPPYIVFSKAIAIDYNGDKWVGTQDGIAKYDNNGAGPFVHYLNIGSNQTLCQGDSIQLSVNIPNGTTLWNNGSTNSSLWVTQAGTYWASVTSNGQIYNDTITINSYLYSLTDTFNVCLGDSFVFHDGTVINNIISQVTHINNLQSYHGCDSIVTTTVNVTIVDTSVTVTGTLLSSNNTNSLYQWLNCNNNNAIITGANNQIFAPNSSGSYAIKINTNGCIDTSSCISIDMCNIVANFNTINHGNGKYSFNHASSGYSTKRRWALGDGTDGMFWNVSGYTFAANGTYIVVFTLYDATGTGYCFDYHIDTVIVTGVPNPAQCNAGFVFYPDTVSGDITVVNSSTGTNLTYFWDFGDGNTSTQAYPTHLYATAGPFYLCLTVDDGAGCNDMYCDSIGENGVVFNKQVGFTINVLAPPVITGLENNLVSSLEVEIYPNPVSEQLTIVSNQTINELTIIDITGKAIKLIKENTNAINVADLSKGIYFIKLVTDEGTITKKFVKQ